MIDPCTATDETAATRVKQEKLDFKSAVQKMSEAELKKKKKK